MKHNKHLIILFPLLFLVVFIAIAGVFGASFFVFKSINKKEVVDAKYSVIGSRGLARDWIVANSPTYKFDGDGLVFKGYKNLNCKFCYEFTFGFESRYAGYGNRSDSDLVLMPTNHTIVVYLETGMVTKVKTDVKYDEVKGKLVGEENTATSTESQN